jgi:hypothetical protein
MDSVPQREGQPLITIASPIVGITAYAQSVTASTKGAVKRIFIERDKPGLRAPEKCRR